MGAVAAEGTAADAGEAESGGGQDAVAVAQGSSVPSVGPRVIQTASLTLSVPRNDFEKVVDRARLLATSSGGFVVESSASQSGDERRLVRRGAFVLRIPEQSYSRVMKQLSGLGGVEGREEAGQDVSQEFVDLEARERHLEAVEGQLLNLLDQTNTVAEALTVQSQLNQVQLDLEQARGRLQYLEDQVAFATISLDVSERQLAAAAADSGPWSILDAWGDHRRRVRDRRRLDPRRRGHDRAGGHPAVPRLPRLPRRASRAPSRRARHQEDARALSLSASRGMVCGSERPGRPEMATKKKKETEAEAGTLGRLSKRGEEAVI